MQAGDTSAFDVAEWEAGLWQPVATIPDAVPVLVFIAAARFNGAAGEGGWMGQAAPGDWIRQHATLWRPLLPLPGMP